MMLLRTAGRQALAPVLGATVLIPLGDLLIVAGISGPTWQLVLHGVSALTMTAALRLSRKGRPGSQAPAQAVERAPPQDR